MLKTGRGIAREVQERGRVRALVRGPFVRHVERAQSEARQQVDAHHLRRHELPIAQREGAEPRAAQQLRRGRHLGVERLRRMGCRVAVFSGGPVHRSEPLGLLVATRSDGARDVLDDDALRAKVGDVVPWRPGCDGDDAKRAFVGAVPLVARCARFFREAGWALEALVWSGCAVWSTDQLLAEVSRGSWALSPSKWSDASAAADSRGLWGDVVAREAALLPPDSADGD